MESCKIKRFQLSLRRLILGTVAFGGAWTMSVTIGVTDLEEHLTVKYRHDLDRPDLPKWDRKDLSRRPSMPYYYVEASRSYIPCVIRVEHGIMRGMLSGEGGTTYFLWFFWIKYPVWRSESWMS